MAKERDRHRPGYHEDYRRKRPTIGIRVDRETSDRLERLAAGAGTTVAGYLRPHVEYVAAAGKTEYVADVGKAEHQVT